MVKTKQQKIKDFIINNGVIIVMFVLVIYTGFTSKNFFTTNNFMNIFMNMSFRLVIALGIAGCVITAGCDLSAGRMIGFGGCRHAPAAYGLFRKVFPEYEASECISCSAYRYADLRSFWSGDRIFHRVLECTAIHSNAGDDGNRIWYQYDLHQCNTSWRIC